MPLGLEDAMRRFEVVTVQKFCDLDRIDCLEGQQPSVPVRVSHQIDQTTPLVWLRALKRTQEAGDRHAQHGTVILSDLAQQLANRQPAKTRINGQGTGIHNDSNVAVDHSSPAATRSAILRFFASMRSCMRWIPSSVTL